MFSVNTEGDFNQIRSKAGEAVGIDFQLCDAVGQVLPLTSANRKIVFNVFDSKRATILDRDLPVGNDPATGDFVRLLLNGRITDSLYGYTDIRWEFNERLDEGDDTVAPVGDPGTLVVDLSAPYVVDYNAAPLIRYVWRVQRWYDYENGKLVKFTKKLIPYVPLPAQSAPQSSSSSMDFSDPNNSQYAGVMF